MHYIQINGSAVAGVTELSVRDFLRQRPRADYLLLDCRALSQDELVALATAVRTRYILYTHADAAQRAVLAAGGHFDVTAFWGATDFISQLDFMLSDLAQTQGFSAMPDESATVSDDFPGQVTRHGRYEMTVSGDFPRKTRLLDYQRMVANWGKPIYVVPFRRFYNAPGKHLLTFDVTTTGSLAVTYVLTAVARDSHQVLNQLSVTDFSRDHVYEAPEKADFYCQVYVKGKGSATLGKIWTYKYKYGLGYFQMGDERERTADGEWIHSYYIPGKKSGRLIVGFSGNLSELPHYERQSMSQTGYPVLLFCDLRGRGGAFQLGRRLSQDYEKAVTARIERARVSLGLARRDLTFVGWSMGSFPAIYYGMKMQAGNIIAAKPLLHLGDVTGNPQVIYRTEPSMVAAREYLMGRVSPDDTRVLNGLITDCLTFAEVRHTRFYSFHMSNDELDRTEDFFRALKGQAKSVEIAHAAGFHADKIGEMSDWVHEVLMRSLSL